jgi:hypothetical protein
MKQYQQQQQNIASVSKIEQSTIWKKEIIIAGESKFIKHDIKSIKMFQTQKKKKCFSFFLKGLSYCRVLYIL